MTIKRTFLGCNVGIRVKGEDIDKQFSNMELIAKKTREQRTMSQIIIKNINTLTPYKNVLPQYIGNELTISFWSHFFLFLFFFAFLLFLFFNFCSNYIK